MGRVPWRPIFLQNIKEAGEKLSADGTICSRPLQQVGGCVQTLQPVLSMEELFANFSVVIYGAHFQIPLQHNVTPTGTCKMVGKQVSAEFTGLISADTLGLGGGIVLWPRPLSICSAIGPQVAGPGRPKTESE